MKRIEHVLDTVAAIAIVLLGLLITANIIAREVIQTGVPDIMIMVRELMIPAILFPLAGATAARAHIAIEVIANLFPDGLNRWIAVLAGLKSEAARAREVERAIRWAFRDEETRQASVPVSLSRPGVRRR